VHRSRTGRIHADTRVGQTRACSRWCGFRFHLSSVRSSGSSSRPSSAATLRIFGRNLACRPDNRKAFVWLVRPGDAGRWLDVSETGKYALTCPLPQDIEPGTYELWIHGGRGGAWGWGGPLRVEVPVARRRAKTVRTLKPGDDLQAALDAVASRGGGTVRLTEGRFPFVGTLRIPADVSLAGAGRDRTALELQTSPLASFARLENAGWGLAPNAIHTRGDTLTYTLNVPRAGRWTVWMRYGTDMSPWKMSVSAATRHFRPTTMRRSCSRTCPTPAASASSSGRGPPRSS
jgi:hypothetical protein